MDFVKYFKVLREYEKAVEVYRNKAREEYGGDDITIDNDAEIAFADTGVWIQAWVWLEDPEDDEEVDDGTDR